MSSVGDFDEVLPHPGRVSEEVPCGRADLELCRLPDRTRYVPPPCVITECRKMVVQYAPNYCEHKQTSGDKRPQTKAKTEPGMFHPNVFL